MVSIRLPARLGERSGAASAKDVLHQEQQSPRKKGSQKLEEKDASVVMEKKIKSKTERRGGAGGAKLRQPVAMGSPAIVSPKNEATFLML